MEKLTPEQRQEIARKAVQARWAKGSMPGLSRAKRQGKMLGRPRLIVDLREDIASRWRGYERSRNRQQAAPDQIHRSQSATG